MGEGDALFLFPLSSFLPPHGRHFCVVPLVEWVRSQFMRSLCRWCFLLLSFFEFHYPLDRFSPFFLLGTYNPRFVLVERVR